MNVVRRAAAFGLGALAVYVAVLSAYSAVRGGREEALSARLSDLQSEARKVESVNEESQDFARRTNALKQQLQWPNRLLPAEPGLSAIEDTLRRLAELTGLMITSVRPGAQVSKEFHTELPIEVAVRGPNEAVLDFVERVGRLPRLMTVGAVELESDGARARARISLVAYRYGA